MDCLQVEKAIVAVGASRMMELLCAGLLFDLDGVLIDSMSCVSRHWAAWAARNGLPVARVLAIAHGVRTVETIHSLAPHLDAEQEAARFTAGEIADTDGVVAMQGAALLLSALPERRWGVVTSGSRKLAQARLSRAGLPIPEILVGGDEVTQGKPAPDPYLEGARRLGNLPVDCVGVEDAPAGIRSALAAGMRVVAIASTHPRDQLRATAVVDRLSDIRIQANADGQLPLTILLPGP
jgi:sugar-phosphatase